MAGYKTAGAEFVNATLINTQADRQRAKFEENFNGKGSSNQARLSAIFSHDDNLVGARAEEKFQQIVSDFADLDNNSGGDPGANPDFPNGVALNYKDGFTEQSLDGADDNPNKLGPNTSVPSENTFDPGTIRQPQDPVNLPNANVEESQLGGFGFKIDRNTRTNGSPEVLGSYFSKFYDSGETQTAQPTLGEFVDSDSLSY